MNQNKIDDISLPKVWELMDFHTEESKKLIKEGKLDADDPRAIIFVESEQV